MAIYSNVVEPENTAQQIRINDNWEDDFRECIERFEEEKPKCDITKSQAHWNACLRYCYKELLKPPCNLRDNRACIVDYRDIRSLNILLDAYITLCNENGRDTSIMGFHHLTGIATNTMQSWKNKQSNIDYYNNSFGYSADELSRAWLSMYKKIDENHEEALRSKLYDSNNCTAQAIIVNHDWGWNTPNMRVDEEAKQQARLTREELRRVATNDYSKVLLPPV